MTPEHRIERFFEKYQPFVKQAANVARLLGEQHTVDMWKEMAEDLQLLREGVDPPLEYYI